MDLALILEFGARQRLLALGRISALLPSADNDLVRLNMEAMGVHRLRCRHRRDRCGAGGFAPRAQVPDHRCCGAARGLRRGPGLRARRGRVQPALRRAGNGSGAQSRGHRAELGQQPATDLRGVLRDHLQHRAVRRTTPQLYAERRRVQRGRRRRLRRAGAARAAALHRRLPRQAAVEARLAQPVQVSS